MAKFLKKSQILEAKDRKFETVEVPEWGGDVNITVLTGAQRHEWEKKMLEMGKTEEVDVKIRERLLSLVICDEELNPLFPGDKGLEELSEKSSLVLTRLYEKAVELSKVKSDAVEEAVKNSEDPQSDSISASA